MNRLERLELDIDCRLLSLWREALEMDEWTLEAVGIFMRAAFGMGYTAALTDGTPSLYLDHGYKPPERV